MRALSIRDPWAQAIVNGPKRVENRTWAPPEHIRGQRIAIHTSKKVEHNDAQDLADHALFDYKPGEAYPGYIIGVATIIGVMNPETHQTETWVEGVDIPPHCIVDWFVTGCWGWLLDDVHALTRPIPAKGMLGLWTVPPHVESDIISQMQVSP